jgi:hypothetical protein
MSIFQNLKKLLEHIFDFFGSGGLKSPKFSPIVKENNFWVLNALNREKNRWKLVFNISFRYILYLLKEYKDTSVGCGTFFM